MTTSTATTHDIIIVGGGTAGCVLAARLSAVPELKVLLLEAGGDHSNDPRINTPMLFGAAFGDPNVDWNYRAVPQKELHDKPFVIPRGKGLGGSSLINLMQLTYPTKEVVEAWVEAGNDTWGWEGMVTYLRRFHHFTEPEKGVDDAPGSASLDQGLKGKDGPVQASFPREVNPVHAAFVDTFRNLASAGDGAAEAFRVPSTVDAGSRTRSHAASAYLSEAVRARSNLMITTNANVRRVLMTGNRATGVEHQVAGGIVQAHALREVIICCGTIGTPTLLERSGIGRTDVLKKLGVQPAVLNQGVGENLHDHLLVGCSFQVKDHINTADSFRDPEVIQKAMLEYQQSRSGPMTATSGVTGHLPLVDVLPGVALDQLLASHAIPGSAYIQVAERYVSHLITDKTKVPAAYYLSSGQVHLEHNNMSAMFVPSSPGSYISIWCALAAPLSRGSVHAQSVDSDDAAIDPRYLIHPLDVEIMIAYLRDLNKILQTEPLKSLLKPNGQRIPAWATDLDSRDVCDRLLRESSVSFNHPVGSCSMLPQASGGVVDQHLRVYGAEGLRIVDASVIPIIPRGPIMSSVYAIAEKAADIIKVDLGFRG